MALPLYALTLFISAFILFLVQPIVGKIILPKLGGTPQVWNTCMVFFQMVLLAGYAYTHNVSTRLSLRQQLILHVIVLALPLIVLLPFPFAFGGGDLDDLGRVTNSHSLWGFVPDLGSNPIPSTLAVLFLYVGLPFVVVATTAPLLQKWFVHTGHPAAKDPYFLYGASNLGSMLSLILYPLILEPEFKLQQQGWTYTFGYLCLVVFVLICAAMVWNSKEAPLKLKHEPAPAPAAPVSAAAAQTGITATAPAPTVAPAPAAASTSVKPGSPPPKAIPKAAGRAQAAHDGAPVSIQSDVVDFARRFRWVLLAAIPSSLMLGITTHITTDLSPMPLFWLIPLILYLGSFILVFMRWPIVWTEKAHVYFLFAQPFFIMAMIMVDVMNFTGDTRYLVFAIVMHVLGFFTTTMVCHGELAKDRPGTRHLTEFYLWMSVGGMLGGMFNALIAPVIFDKLWELPLAIFAAVLVRPKMFDTGFLDNFLAALFEGKAEAPAAKAHQKGHRPTAAAVSGGVVANESLVRTLDFAWPALILVFTGALLLILGTTAIDNSKAEADRVRRNLAIDYTLPLVLACICLTRPLRVGLGIGAVLLILNVQNAMNDRSIYATRSYFGIISVKEGDQVRKVNDKNEAFRFRQLIHGHIDHGMNFLIPQEKKDRGNPLKDLSRLATTYYHREGPVGRVMEKYNWFPGKENSNTYWGDARIGASLVGNAIADLGTTSALPMSALVTAWSEPPIATIGLGTGTMASYGRPYQHVHFYEIDNQIRILSLGLPTREIRDYKQYMKERDTRLDKYFGSQGAFNYLEQAIERGCSVQVLMGDARLRMALPYKNHYETFQKNEPDDGGGPRNFYYMMVVDAFSSDAIPAHLLTMESFQMYFEHLTEQGILCVHTSNRFVDLPKVVSAVAGKLGYAHLRGHDADTDRPEGHYTSEWVMVARDVKYLERLIGDTKFLLRYDDKTKGKQVRSDGEDYWQSVPVNFRYAWTDDHYNLLSVVRFRARPADE